MVDGRCDEGGGLGVGTSDGQEVRAHDIGLGTDGNQTVDVLADGDEDLAGHVATLLCAGGLIFDVDTGGTTLDEQLGELHDSGQTAMSGVSIGDNGSQVVDVGDVSTLASGGSNALLALFTVMEELCHEQLVHLARHGVLWSTCKYAPTFDIASIFNLPWGNRPDRERAHRLTKQ